MGELECCAFLLAQLNMLQKELAEAKSNLEELQYEKEEADKKIIELNATISGLEHDKTRTHTFDTSEFKVNVFFYLSWIMNMCYTCAEVYICVQCVFSVLCAYTCAGSIYIYSVHAFSLHC